MEGNPKTAVGSTYGKQVKNVIREEIAILGQYDTFYPEETILEGQARKS